ncbi:hypothetical protein G3M48_008815, partial [Beauveria asiatica]
MSPAVVDIVETPVVEAPIEAPIETVPAAEEALIESKGSSVEYLPLNGVDAVDLPAIGATKLRKMIFETKELIVCPGVYDGLSARTAIETGFSAMYMTGAGTTASRLGQPDLAIAQLHEMRENAEMIANLDPFGPPLIADMDTGYGVSIIIFSAWKSPPRRTFANTPAVPPVFSRVAQLEQKLDGIMSLLESSQRSNRRRPSSTGSSASTAGDGSSSPLTPDSHSHSHNNPSPLRRTRAAVDTTARGAIPSDEEERQRMSAAAAHADRGRAESIEMVPGFAVTFAEAAEYLQIYRNDYMPVFPFVIVEETARPHELHRNAPALFWMIMAAVAQTSEEVDAAVKTWLRHYVAETMIIKQEKTLELLQAILVHLV